MADNAHINEPKPDTVPLTNLKAGAAKVDITPPISVPLGGYADREGPATGIRDPLYAVTIVFDDGDNRTALVTLDTLQVMEKDGDAFRKAVKETTGIPSDHIIFNTSHTHGSPWLYTDEAYNREVTAKVAGAVSMAAESLRPVSLGYGEGVIDFNINRRCIDADGKCHSGLNPDGICDHRVKVLRIDDGNNAEPMAIIMHAVCHANVFRGANTEITADFPGAAKAFVERNFGGKTTAMFLQGCSGDVRANLPSIGGWKSSIDDFGRSGGEIDMMWCGWSLGAEAVRVAAKLRVREQVEQRADSYRISAAHSILQVTADENKLDQALYKRDRIENGKIVFPVKAIRIGDIWFVGLPGEPMGEYALDIEKDMAKLGNVFVLGYTSGDVGYFPRAHMFEEGGYEADGPYTTASEREILEGVRQLISNLAE